MASEQLIKEELQNGAGGSVQRAPSSHVDDNESTGTLDRAAQLGVTNGVKSEGEMADDDEQYAEEGSDGGEEDAEGEDEDEDEGEDDGDFDHDEAGDYESEGAVDDLEEDETILPNPASRPRLRVKHIDDNDDEDDEVLDSDEAEDVDVGDHEVDDDDSADDRHEEDEDEDEDAVENAEGVGAVKIRPGETDEDDDSEASAAASESSDDEWDENAEQAEEEDEDEEDGDADATTCLYCKRGSEEKAPSAFYTCSVCSDTAHQACASENGNISQEDGAWKCPDCNDEKGSPVDLDDEMEIDVGDQQDANGAVYGTPSGLASLKATTPNPSPALRSATANAESVSGDHTDAGSRSLRKRRTSPIESVDSGMSLRKRRKNTTDNLSIDGFSDIRDTAAPSSVRSLRIKPPMPSQVSILKRNRSSLILKLKVPPADLRRITVKKRKYTKRGTVIKISKKEKKRLEKLAAGNGLPVDSNALPVMPSTTSYTQPFYSFFDKETEEQKGKPYGGILNEAEADTSKTFPTPDDRRRFDEAKQKAEEEWRARLFAMQSEADAQPAKKKKASGPASQIECIEFGGWEIGTWYAAPYPEEYSRNRVLYICEFCLKYMNSDYVAWRHKLKCPAKHPPGDEIYRHRSISFFEVDGRKNPVYCQNLCLLAKLFLGSKTLYYDVEPFLFYVLCEYDEFGYHFVGYFSKEKRASSQNNVSCILTLPIHQRKGYGNLLIDFSYLLTRVEEKTGSPEKPLSDMGLVSYRNYWRLIMCQYLLKAMSENQGNGSDKLGLSIKKISDDTGMTADDVISALEGLRCLVRDPQTGLYAFRVDVAYCQEYVAKWAAKKYVTLNPDALTWTPYVMGRGNATNFELGPALTAIAPREEDEEQKAAEDYVASLANENGESQRDANVMSNGVAADAADETVATSGEMHAHPDATAVLESTEPKDNGDRDSSMDGAVNSSALVESNETVEQQEGVSVKDDTQPGEDTALRQVDGNAGPAAAVVGDETEREDGRSNVQEDGTHIATTTAPADEHTARVSANAHIHDVRGDDEGGDGGDSGSDWASAYDSVPATRFVVFPTVSARRLNYGRGPIGRPPGARTGSGARGRSRYSSNGGTAYARRSAIASSGGGGADSVSRPKAASSSSKRRKSGGTGRGPGRWPKGTKKSDYGNADSGPGLPPSWLSTQTSDTKRGSTSRMNGVNGEREGHDHDHYREHGVDEDHHEEAEADDNEDAEGEEEHDEVGAAAHEEGEGGEHEDEVKDADAEDDEGVDEPAETVQVHTPTAPRLVDKRNGLHAVALESASRGRSSPRLGKMKAQQEGDDTVMVDA